MSNKQFILLENSTHLKCQFIIHPFRILFRNNTFFICYFFTKPSPSSFYIIAIFILSERIYGWSHPIVEQRIRFGKIDNRKGIFLIDHQILYWKIEPLIISNRIHIIRHNKIVLCRSDLNTKRFTLKAANKFPL